MHGFGKDGGGRTRKAYALLKSHRNHYRQVTDPVSYTHLDVYKSQSLGLMLASGVIGLLSFLLSDEAFLAWGWRIAFILSAVLVLVGAYIRTSVQETQDFSSAKKEVEKIRYPMLEAFKRYPKTLTACVGARFVEGIAFNAVSYTHLAQHRHSRTGPSL